MRRLYQSCSINGPRAVAWGLRKMGDICPPGSDRHFYLQEADKAMDDAARMLKVKRGWMKFGEEDPWWVVFPQGEPILARYNSDSLLWVKDGTLEEYFGGRGVCPIIIESS